MAVLLGCSILVFDTPSLRTERLKRSLVREGASVRVSGSIIAAMDIVQAVKIDAAFVAYRADPVTRDLCRLLRARGVPTIFTGSCPKSDAHRVAS